MRNLDKTRKYEVLDVTTTSWVPAHWEQLDEGDVVRSCDSTTYDGPMTEEYVVAHHPALMVDVVKGQCRRPTTKYKTVAGDTLKALAARHDVSTHFIRYTNWMRDEDDASLTEGIELELPVPTPRPKSELDLKVERLRTTAQAMIDAFAPYVDPSWPSTIEWQNFKAALDAFGTDHA